MSVVFILGSHRSGSTSLLRALELSAYTACQMEPMSNLNIESRHHLDGHLWDPYRPLIDHVAPRVATGLQNRRFYVEKQNSLVPFIPQLARLFGAKFIVPVRDGRDVAASLVDWHSQMYPIIYRECQEPVQLGPHAQHIQNTQPGFSEFDHSLPRPKPKDPWHESWPAMTRFEMCAWYWNYINLELCRLLRNLPEDRYMVVDYTTPTVDAIRRVYDFIGLPDFNAAAVEALLARKVNSLRERIDDEPRFPRWPDWTPWQRQRFDDLAHDAMAALGYVHTKRCVEPALLAPTGQQTAADPVAAATNWLRIAAGSTPQSALVLGSTVDALAFAGIPGLRVRTRAICVEDRADIVVSLDGLQQVVDIDHEVRSLVANAKELLYLKTSNQHFGEMSAHRYRHAAGGPKVDPSGFAVQQTLKEAGMGDAIVYPRRVDAHQLEVIAVAGRRPLRSALRPKRDEIAFSFRPYSASSSNLPRTSIEARVNASCAYLSAPPFDLADDLASFERWLSSFAALPGRRFGRMSELASGEGRVNSSIRVDVDADLVAGLGMAQLMNRKGCTGSFYLLHTAGYHGSVQNGAFVRNTQSAAIYREMEGHGVELGLHADPYKLYLDDDLDGAIAVTTELDWLRDEGLTISGFSAHNCVPVYGVENFEIFSQHAIRTDGWVNRRGKFAPVGLLDARELGLSYEAGNARPGPAAADPDNCPYVTDWPVPDLVRDFDWMRTYLHANPYSSWGYEARLWVLGRDRWVLSMKTEHRDIFIFDKPFSVIEPMLAELRDDERLVVTLHPEYFGRRSSPTEPPFGM